jgi:hypothetical protein
MGHGCCKSILCYSKSLLEICPESVYNGAGMVSVMAH